jgi:hypothetical protein
MEDFLEHVGVKGMKWGVRKADRSGNTPKAQAKRMSDAELKTAVERLRMEQQYVQITHSLNPPPFMKNLLAKHGNQAVNTVLGLAITALVGSAMKKVKGTRAKVPFKGLKENISFN